MTQQGVEGTVLGTLCMPYLSGLGNLLFVFIVLKNGRDGSEVIINCLVNNTTNMTLLLGLPALFWGLVIVQKKKGKKRERQTAQVNRLSLMLTLAAMLFFCGVTWALGKDGTLDSGDGLALIGLFLFWQVFHIYEVLKENVQKPKPYSAWLILDIAILLGCGFILYFSIEQLVDWLVHLESGLVNSSQMGLLSGWLMVLPNAILALYYAAQKRSDIVYTSQVGDGHICIPLCIGLFATFKDIIVPAPFNLSLLLIAGACILHALFIMLWGQLPRMIGALLVLSYGIFFYMGFL